MNKDRYGDHFGCHAPQYVRLNFSALRPVLCFDCSHGFNWKTPCFSKKTERGQEKGNQGRKKEGVTLLLMILNHKCKCVSAPLPLHAKYPQLLLMQAFKCRSIQTITADRAVPSERGVRRLSVRVRTQSGLGTGFLDKAPREGGQTTSIFRTLSQQIELAWTQRLKHYLLRVVPQWNLLI